MLNDSVLLAAAVLAPAAVALALPAFRARRASLFATAGPVVAGASFLAVLWLGVSAISGDPAVHAGDGVLGVRADSLSLVLLFLIFGVSAVVQTFATRYLAGDPHAAKFTAGAGTLTTASAMLATGGTLITVAIGWTAAGIALCFLLGMYWHLPQARDGVRRTATAFVIGDVALWAAVGLMVVRAGDAALPTTEVDAHGSVLVAIFVVIAALSRSAQIPFHFWLPATLCAPTPVSALLHAGVVNAGGILLVRLSPLGGGEIASLLVVLAGGATMVYGALVMMVKPDVKGALAFSTMAQMGFMMFTVGLGLWAAAVIHLVAHGFYKSTLFLASGSAIATRRREASLPPPGQVTGPRRAALRAAAVLLPLGALAAAVLVIPGGESHSSAMALLIFAWVTGAAATHGWLSRRPDGGGVLTAGAVLLAAAGAYVAVINAVSTFLAPSLPDTTIPALTVAAGSVTAFVLLVGLAALRWSPLRDGLYTRALDAGHVQPTLMGARS